MIYKKPPEKFKPIYHVASCFCEYDGRVLLLRRQDHKSEGDKWGIPAGKIEPPETALQTIVRELKEEVGLVVEERNLTDLGNLYVRFPDYDFTFHIFRTLLPKFEELKIDPKEHKELVWVTPAEAIKMNLVLDQEKCFALYYPSK